MDMALLKLEETAGRIAPGKPGVAPAWSNSAKAGVGTAVCTGSRLWFTLAEGVVTEVFYPQLDTAATRDLQFLIADGRGFFSEQRRDTRWSVQEIEPGVPAYRLKNSCKHGRYLLEQEIIADPRRSALLIRVRFVPLQLEEPLLYVLLAPHLANRGWGNSAWVGDVKGSLLLCAKRDGLDGPNVLALGCSIPFRKASAGYSGFSDGWQDVRQNGRMLWEYSSAPDGNVALTAELETNTQPLSFVLALGFGNSIAGAAFNVRAALIDGFDGAMEEYASEWKERQAGLVAPGAGALGDERIARVSMGVLCTHEAKEFRGGMVASLSTPWGQSRGDGKLGYHMVWTRDLIEACGGLAAVEAHDAARRVLTYLHATQEADGRWAQNMWVDGRPHWTGVQLDEIALPIILAANSERRGTLNEAQLAALWPTMEKAAQYLMQHGPVTPEDRWEQFSGYSAFTLAVQISALLCAADCAEKLGDGSFAAHARGLADHWNAKIEDWIYVKNTPLARRLGLEGYYAFIVPERPVHLAPADRPVSLRHWPAGSPPPVAGDVVSPDALALVRFGLRAANDPKMRNTVRAIDETLKVETAHGPCWRRFLGDAYGENAAGEPYSDGGEGIGRAWPLLTGERAHFELAAGNRAEAVRLMHAMEAFANSTGFFSEQIWDAADIPAKGLFHGRPTGSAMPLTWAHAEYLKLRRSIADGRVFDMPTETERYRK